MDIAAFLTRWRGSGASERANYQLFLSELCDVLGVARPEPSSATSRDYVFERDVRIVRDDGSESIGRIDLYKRGCFVLEAKQGADAEPERRAELTEREAKLAKKKRGHGTRGSASWDDAMYNARRQAERYARALPVDEGWPPFLVVVDVGHSIELYADFARSGKLYVPFPDPRGYRVLLSDLESDAVRARLRAVFDDPMSLDPSRVSAAVTRAVAVPIAELARELEAAGHDAGAVAEFLMRCLFTMFAEDVGLLPEGSFTGLLSDCLAVPEGFTPMLEALWATMNEGGFSPVLRRPVLKFNGYLFKKPRRRGATGARWSRRSSARCSSERSTRGSGTSWARTTRRARTSSGWSSRRSSIPCATSGRRCGRRRSSWRSRGRRRRRSRPWRHSIARSARRGCSIRRAGRATSST